MKKTLVMAAIFACSLSVFSQDISMADMNGDGKISVLDICQMVNVMNSNQTVSEGAVLRGDVNGDGVVDIKDINYAQAYTKENQTVTAAEFPSSNGEATNTTEPAAPTTASASLIDNNEYVDLGLSVLWAKTNVGAETPDEYGDYYAWGETDTKDSYSWKTYSLCFGSKASISKYCDDAIKFLDLSDDAAHVNMGGEWRMPTYDEFRELSKECYWSWTDNYNGTGINGYIIYKVKQEKDKTHTGQGIAPLSGYSLADTHIFLPTAGVMVDGQLVRDGVEAHYWINSLYSTVKSSATIDYATNIFWTTKGTDFGQGARYSGRTVRGVHCK